MKDAVRYPAGRISRCREVSAAKSENPILSVRPPAENAGGLFLHRFHAEILNFRGSTHRIGVGSFGELRIFIKEGICRSVGWCLFARGKK